MDKRMKLRGMSGAVEPPRLLRPESVPKGVSVSQMAMPIAYAAPSLAVMHQVLKRTGGGLIKTPVAGMKNLWGATLANRSPWKLTLQGGKPAVERTLLSRVLPTTQQAAKMSADDFLAAAAKNRVPTLTSWKPGLASVARGTAGLGTILLGSEVALDDLIKLADKDTREEGIIDTGLHSILGEDIIAKELRNQGVPPTTKPSFGHRIKSVGDDIVTAGARSKGIGQGFKQTLTKASVNPTVSKVIGAGATAAHGGITGAKSLLGGATKFGTGVVKGAGADAVGSLLGYGALEVLDKSGALQVLPGIDADSETGQYVDEYGEALLEGMGVFGGVDAAAGAVSNLREDAIEEGRQQVYGDPESILDQSGSDMAFVTSQFGSDESLIDDEGDVDFDVWKEAPIQNTAAIAAGTLVGGVSLGGRMASKGWNATIGKLW